LVARSRGRKTPRRAADHGRVDRTQQPGHAPRCRQRPDAGYGATNAGPADPHFGESIVFIANAFAQTSGAAPSGDMLTSFLPMIAIFVVFYFLLIRPQQKRAKEQRELLGALEKGNEVVTAGGMVGKIAKINEQYVTLEVASGVEVTVQRSSVSQLLPKGTLKSL
jgi:preprotein translocase subunit YajC